MGFKRQRWRVGPRHASGFTLVEHMISVAVLALFVSAAFAAILLNRVSAMKSKEEAIAMDFLIHYIETVKGLPFNEVVPGQAINPLLDGTADGPNIRIPADSSWVSLATQDFEAFHPDLLWIQHRNPQMRAILNRQMALGSPHDLHLNVMVAWDAPLRLAGRLQVQLDLVRTKDL
jgi:prepilin-type N-terminal cleavage/methylation domain-containing protein